MSKRFTVTEWKKGHFAVVNEKGQVQGTHLYEDSAQDQAKELNRDRPKLEDHGIVIPKRRK